MASRSKKPVWEQRAPADAKHTHLSAKKKAQAKARAKRAGRPYPNLVDNLRAAKSKKKPAKNKTARRKPASSRSGAR